MKNQKHIVIGICFLLQLLSLGACSTNKNTDFASKPANPPQETSGYISVLDHHIYYESKGKGESIVFLHGGYLHHEMWDEETDFFASKGFKTIAYDGLGHGKTKDGTTKVLGSKILEHLLDSLNISQTHLVGLSWGAMIAVDFCLTHPERVKKMVLVSPGLNGWEYFQDSLVVANNLLRKKAKLEADTSAFVELFMKNWTDGPAQKTDRLPSKTRIHIQKLIRETVTKHWNKDWSGLIEDPPARQRLSEIQQPVLLVKGNLDALDIHQIVEVYQESLPNAYRFDIPNVAHALNLEEADLFNELLMTFIRRP
ncbi:MAG: alpha/beta fold hydrolase [Chitinophagales bacterium]